MKKLFLMMMAAMLLPLTMSAQLLAQQGTLAQRNPYALKTFNNKLMAPARIDLPSNQKVLGHYDTDDIQTGGYLGLTNFPGVIPTATELTRDELAFFDGGKIVAMRVGLSVSTPVTRVFVIPIDTEGNMGNEVSWECNVSAMGWNMVELETPYEINVEGLGGLMIGFDYKQTSSNYPLSYVELGEAYYPTYCYLTYNGQTGWFDIGATDYGNLSLQCIVESDNYPEYYIEVASVASYNFIQAGNDIDFAFRTRNFGTATIEAGNYTYDVAIDGNVVATIPGEVALGTSYIDLNGSVSSAGLEAGPHTLTVQVASINGEPVENGAMKSFVFRIYTSSLPHQMFLLEQFTSTYCTYCPLGVGVLETLMGMRDDIAWVGVHQNMSGTDPMRTIQCDTIANYQGGYSYPSASFNRSTGFESATTVACGLGYDETYHAEVAEALSSFYDYLAETPSFATVNINSTFDPETRKAVVTVDGQLSPEFDLLMGEDSKLSVYITEDSIVARQLNAGRWVNNFVHNGVVRRALGSAMGVSLKRDGDTYKNEFTYTIPDAWNVDKLNVVAFISRPLANGKTGDYTDLYVNQTNKRKLGEQDAPAYERGDVNMDGIVDVSDVSALIEFLLDNNSSLIDLEAADTTLDQTVDVSDVIMLINYLLENAW